MSGLGEWRCGVLVGGAKNGRSLARGGGAVDIPQKVGNRRLKDGCRNGYHRCRISGGSGGMGLTEHIGAVHRVESRRGERHHSSSLAGHSAGLANLPPMPLHAGSVARALQRAWAVRAWRGVVHRGSLTARAGGRRAVRRSLWWPPSGSARMADCSTKGSMAAGLEIGAGQGRSCGLKIRLVMISLWPVMATIRRWRTLQGKLRTVG